MMTNKEQVIAKLQEIRRAYRALKGDTQRFRLETALELFRIEQETPEYELWTSLPREIELTPQHKIGDHLAVTRSALGFLP